MGDKWKRQQLQKEEEDKWNKEREAQRLKRLKQQREEEEKWELELERNKEQWQKNKEQHEITLKRQQEALEAKRKAEEERILTEEQALLKRNQLSFSSLPIKQTKSIAFEKVMTGNALQQSLLLTQQELKKEERKQNRVYLTFTLSGIPEKTGRLEPSDGWFYSNELIIYRAKTLEIPESKLASIDRIVIRALPENLYKSVTVKYTWFGLYELLPKKSMSVQTEDKKSMSIQTQTEVEDAIQDEARNLLDEVVAEQIKEMEELRQKMAEEAKKRKEEEERRKIEEEERLRQEQDRLRREEEDRMRKEREMEAMRQQIADEEKKRREVEEALKREEELRQKMA